MSKIDVKPLKLKATDFPEPIKTLILSEPDIMDSAEFLTKFVTWRRLARISEQKQEVYKK
jgi:hypothetical protein